MLLAGLATSAAALELVDDRGRKLVLEQPPARIVTLAPNLAEIAFAAGAGDRIVGVSMFTDYPPAATRLPQVSASGRTDFEAIVRLKVDLALAWVSGNRPSDLERLERLGVPVFATEARRLADVPRLVRTIGRLAGDPSEAEASALAFERAVTELRARYAARPTVRVFYEIWHEPLMTIGGTHLVSDVLATCGARNVFELAQGFAFPVSAEQLYARAPDAIVVSTFLGSEASAAARWRQRFAPLAAVQAGHVYFIDSSLANRMGPRLAEGAATLCGLVDRARTRD
ncbi:MAG: cobalamin-binding protein [Burkholderiales bacterium]|nr:cobalamin-binding protein [Burkholderiales bacterium]